MDQSKPKFKEGDWAFHYEAGRSGTITERYCMADGVWGYGVKYSNEAIGHVDEHDLFSRAEWEELRNPG